MLLLLLLLFSPLSAAEHVTAGVPRQRRVSEPPSVSSLSLNFQRTVTVQEGLCHLVPCTFLPPQPTSTSTYGYWYRIRDDFRKDVQRDVLVATNNQLKTVRHSSFQLLGKPGTGNCTLSLVSPRKEDSGKYYFQLHRGSTKYGSRDSTLTVEVTELTTRPKIRVHEPLRAGVPNVLGCHLPGACTGAWAPTISWSGAALQPSGFAEGRKIQLTPRPQDHGTNLTCRVTLAGVGTRGEATLRLQVSYPPQSLTIHTFRDNCTGPKAQGNDTSLPVLEGAALRLVCEADSNPPSRLSWASGNGTLNSLQSWGPSGVLELPRVQLNHEGELTCWAENPWGVLSSSLRLSVGSPPQLQGPSCSQEDEVLSCSCSSQAWPAPALRWWLGDHTLGVTSNDTVQVSASSQGPWTNGSLSLRGGLGAGLRLSCAAQNTHGIKSAGVLLLPGKREPGDKFLLGAAAGAGAAGLLAFCFCLACFLVKTHRKVAATRKEAPSSSRSTSGCWDNQPECPPSSLAGSPDPICLAPTLRKEQEEEEAEEEEKQEEAELHYASLSFLQLKPWDPPDQDALHTSEYAEIKTQP